ncbi:MAG: glycosyltransferase [Plesiomonas sp.]|uniref:glycosyltransferase n=1 Tax=Plesiomonas sp. TaxID=2486279 RepID=UPI003F333633
MNNHQNMENRADKPPLVVLGEDWGGHPSSTQHLIKRLLHDRQIIWVNSIGLRRPRFNRRDLTRLWQKLWAILRHHYQKKKHSDINSHTQAHIVETTVVEAMTLDNTNIEATKHQTTKLENTDSSSEYEAISQDTSTLNAPFVIAPLALPLPGVAWARPINRYLLKKQILSVMKKHHITSPILWLSLPTGVDLIDTLNERAVIYYCGDDFSALAGVDHQAIHPLEQELVEKADLILAASPTLASRFPPEKTQLLPHGVDIQLFSQPQARAVDLPIGKPIAGFYGSLSTWINVELLAEVARTLTNWNFVLIGPIQTDISAFHGIKNIYILGPRAHHDLPAYVQYWQVSMLPFYDNAQIRACNPLKLREYLAAKKPIVCTDFPALDGYRDLIHTANSAHSFCMALQLAALDTPKQSYMFEQSNNKLPTSLEINSLETDHTYNEPANIEQFSQWLKHSSPDWDAVIQLGMQRHERYQRVTEQSWEARVNDLNLLLDRL